MRFAASGAALLLLLLTPAFARAEALTLTSPAFADGQMMPSKYGFAGNATSPSCGGAGGSPPLSWSGAPAATKSFALSAIDPDGRGGQGVVHMVIYNIAASATSLADGAAASSWTAGMTIEAPAWRPVCPPVGATPHHYVFQVYALDADLHLAPGLTRDALLKAVAGHTLGLASLIGRYARRQ